MRSTLVLLSLLALAAAFWSDHGRAHPDRLHTVVFVVNPKAGDSTCSKMLMDVSDPDSANYGKHKTLEQVNAVFLDQPAVDRVHAWLKEQGFRTVVVGDYIRVTSTVARLESLLAAKFNLHSHVRHPGHTFLHSEEHTVPAEIAEDVEFVSSVQRPRVLPRVPVRQVNQNAIDRNNATTPQTLWSHYEVKNTSVAKATQAIFAALGQDFSPSDLKMFIRQYKTRAVKINKVIGPNNDNACNETPDDCGEANLDVQYMLSMSAAVNSMFHSIPGDGDIFTEAMSALAAMQKPPQVYSISYGDDTRGKDEAPREYVRWNLEVCKLGVRGTTVLVASGDDGANGASARQGRQNCEISPSYPATCPYVLAVGATIGPQENKEEVVCSSDVGGWITSGGGFSWAFPRPTWQDEKVQPYIDAQPKSMSGKFTTKGRGYPDVAALGYNFQVVIGGKTVGEAGTSASTPTTAGFITLINDRRIAKGKSPVGFVNPALYKAPADHFIDITKGRSHCAVGPVCCPDGFTAAKGWDAITGLGAPNVAKLLDYFETL